MIPIKIETRKFYFLGTKNNKILCNNLIRIKDLLNLGLSKRI